MYLDMTCQHSSFTSFPRCHVLDMNAEILLSSNDAAMPTDRLWFMPVVLVLSSDCFVSEDIHCPPRAGLLVTQVVCLSLLRSA